MPAIRTQLFTALLALLSVACSQTPTTDTKAAAPAPAVDKDKDLADIKALEDRFMAALKAKDVNAIMSVYVPDESLVVFDMVPPRQYVGASAYRKDWESFLAFYPGPIDVGISDLDVSVGGGDVAFSHSIQHVAGTMKGGKKVNVNVRVTDGYKRVNGQWLIAHEHVSIPVDFLTAKPDFTSKP